MRLLDFLTQLLVLIKSLLLAIIVKSTANRSDTCLKALRLISFGLNMAVIAILCINGIASLKPDRFLALNDIFQLRLQGVPFFPHLFGSE